MEEIIKIFEALAATNTHRKPLITRMGQVARVVGLDPRSELLES